MQASTDSDRLLIPDPTGCDRIHIAHMHTGSQMLYTVLVKENRHEKIDMIQEVIHIFMYRIK